MDDRVLRAEPVLLVPDVARDDVGLRNEAVGDRAPLRTRDHRLDVRVVETEDDRSVERHLVDELAEAAADLLDSREVVEVLGVGVRQHGDRRLKDDERAVGLVGLDDHVLAVAEPRVRAERRELAAHDDRRVEPGLRHDGRDHRRRRGLPVRAGDGDAITVEPHQLGEHLGARNDRDLQVARGDHLGVVLPDGGAGDDEVRALDVDGTVPFEDLGAERGEPLGDRRQLRVRAGDLDAAAEVQQDLGDPGHADAADADHVDALYVSEHWC